jgi:hypothetical protein
MQTLEDGDKWLSQIKQSKKNKRALIITGEALNNFQIPTV